ncbi:MAG TPA: lyase family protein [Oligoflexia bacterium]|nr:lyase family protein [Oligoflexia bacterium]HMP47171.1 lyase family protein [Oligoflexia bacterium]
MKVKKSRLWDKGDSLDEYIHQFTVGNDPEIDTSILPWDILASAAQAIMLEKQELIKKDDLISLLSALREAYKLSKSGDFPIPIELEDCHTALECFLTEECGEAGKRIHTGRSRNDQVLVAMRLLCRETTVNFSQELLSLSTAAFNKATKTTRLQMPGYTHFQPAMPASVGMWFAAIGEHSLELAHEGKLLLDILGSNPLGAAAGFYSTIPIDRNHTTKSLSFRRKQRNPINIQNSRGRFELKLARFMSDIAGLIEKFSWDIIFYNTQESGCVNIPTAFTTGSSIMPQKKNPDVLELLRGKASSIRSAATELEGVISKLPSNYHRDFQLTKEPLLRGIESCKTCLSIFTKVIGSLSFNEERLANSKTPELYATYYAFQLVREGLPFREAYLKTAEALNAKLIKPEELEKDFELIALIIDQEIIEAQTEISVIDKEFAFESSLLKNLERELFSAVSSNPNTA